MPTNVVRNQLTLLELAKRMADDNLLTIVEVLAQDNEIIDDAQWLASNQIVSNTTTQRLSLPSGTWRKINKGVAKEASATKQITDAIGRLEAYSYVDKFLIDIAPDKAQFRSGEDMAFVEGLSQALATQIIYGDTGAYPERFDGLEPRYDLLADANVWGCGGTGGDTTSVWVIQWGPTKVHMIYPKHVEGGLGLGIKHEDLREQTIYDATPDPYQAMVSHFLAYGGMVVRNPRCVQRVTNIETSGVTNNFLDSSGEDNLIKALNHMPNRGQGAMIYINETVQSQIDIRAKDKTNVNYTSGEVYGKTVTLFRGFPIRRCDAIINTETVVA